MNQPTSDMETIQASISPVNSYFFGVECATGLFAFFAAIGAFDPSGAFFDGAGISVNAFFTLTATGTQPSLVASFAIFATRSIASCSEVGFARPPVTAFGTPFPACFIEAFTLMPLFPVCATIVRTWLLSGEMNLRMFFMADLFLLDHLIAINMDIVTVLDIRGQQVISTFC